MNTALAYLLKALLWFFRIFEEPVPLLPGLSRRHTEFDPLALRRVFPPKPTQRRIEVVTWERVNLAQMEAEP